MSAQDIPMDVWARMDSDNPEGFRLILVPPEMRYWMGDNDVRLDTVAIKFHSPNMNHEQMVIKAIETLREKQKETLANAQKRVTELDARINQLLMLTHQPAEGVVVLPREQTA